ncbi:hypothetical protein HOY82DRAFT_598777 [Tuber indicum]|nr:hypothetical protein HOY82DRAFT_598777 [Tuber indicum]
MRAQPTDEGFANHNSSSGSLAVLIKTPEGTLGSHHASRDPAQHIKNLGPLAILHRQQPIAEAHSSILPGWLREFYQAARVMRAAVSLYNGSRLPVNWQPAMLYLLV